ncbi:MAG TPA: hypothetical protein VI584_02345 [Nitrospiria bacterium]|nr:hypothetical protein [Nitrospiria bacterium]
MQTKIKDLSTEEFENLISNTVKKTMGKFLEDFFDLMTIEERKAEPEEDYEAYRGKRKLHPHV